jgi:hypothetical protein
MYITVLYVKKDSQTYFSLMGNSVVNVGREEQRRQFDSLVNKQKEEATSAFLFPYMLMEQLFLL